MGYEINFSYREEIEKGVYDTEEVKTKSIKVGNPYEELSLDIVAGKIMAQLARRNILIVDVEIYEYTKKKISYKDTPDGILIKGRKYSFDDGNMIVTDGVATDDTQGLLEQLMANPSVLAMLKGQPNVPVKSTPQKPEVYMPTKPIRYEIFSPIDKIFIDDARKRKLPFTMGNKYPLFAEKPASKENPLAGMLYTLNDDTGNKFVLSDKFFVPYTKPLTGIDENEMPVAYNDGLDRSNYVDDNIVDIRRR